MTRNQLLARTNRCQNTIPNDDERFAAIATVDAIRNRPIDLLIQAPRRHAVADMERFHSEVDAVKVHLKTAPVNRNEFAVLAAQWASPAKVSASGLINPPAPKAPNTEQTQAYWAPKRAHMVDHYNIRSERR